MHSPRAIPPPDKPASHCRMISKSDAKREREREKEGGYPSTSMHLWCTSGGACHCCATSLCKKSLNVHWKIPLLNPNSNRTTEQYGNCAWCGVEADVVESTCFYINLKVIPVSVAHLETIKFASHFVNWYANQFCILSTLSDRSISANDWLARYIAFLLFDDIHVAETILASGHLWIWLIL